MAEQTPERFESRYRGDRFMPPITSPAAWPDDRVA